MELSLLVGYILCHFDLILERNDGNFDENWPRKKYYPGDPFGLLPAPNMLRLVGMKVPMEGCAVIVSPRVLR